MWLSPRRGLTIMRFSAPLAYHGAAGHRTPCIEVAPIVTNSPFPQLTNLLLVDDDASFRKVLRSSLAAAGFTVAEARTGEEAVKAAQSIGFDLVLLDVNMPGMGGIEACERIRELLPHAGILMVTVKDRENDKVSALDAGADDYVTKPVRLRELISRLAAVLRRYRVSVPSAPPTLLEAGALTVDLEERTLWRNGVPVHLSGKEFALLALMMKNQGIPLTHEKLLRSVWGPEYGNEAEYLRAYVRMLRKKVEDDPANPTYILTEPWIGYRFRNPHGAGPEAASSHQPRTKSRETCDADLTES